MNILSHIFAGEASPDEELLAEQEAKEARKRSTPKHGPASYRFQTNGQARRAHQRRQATTQRKTNLRYRRNWMLKQQAKATLRGQLQAVGALSYATDFVAPVSLRAEAATWIVRHFGPRDEEGGILIGEKTLDIAIERALAEYKAA